MVALTSVQAQPGSHIWFFMVTFGLPQGYISAPPTLKA